MNSRLTAASFCAALSKARAYSVALDGDLLVAPDDMKKVLEFDGNCVGGCQPTTDNPVLMTIRNGKVIEFSRKKGELEWTGLAKIKTSDLKKGTNHVYQLIEPLLPVSVIKINTREIDTINDYNNAVKWIKNNYTE